MLKTDAWYLFASNKGLVSISSYKKRNTKVIVRASNMTLAKFNLLEYLDFFGS